MPKRKIRLLGIRQFDPERTLAPYHVRNAYVEHVDFDRAGLGEVQGLPSHEDSGIAGTVEDGHGGIKIAGKRTGKVATLPDEDYYVWCQRSFASVSSERAIYVARFGEPPDSRREFRHTLGDTDSTQRGGRNSPDAYITACSNGQEAYIGTGYSATDTEGNPVYIVGRRRWGRIGVAEADESDDIVARDARLTPPYSPLDPNSEADVWLTPDRTYYDDYTDHLHPLLEGTGVDKDGTNLMFKHESGYSNFDEYAPAHHIQPYHRHFYWSKENDPEVPFDASLKYFYKVSYTYRGIEESPLVDLRVKHPKATIVNVTSRYTQIDQDDPPEGRPTVLSDLGSENIEYYHYGRHDQYEDFKLWEIFRQGRPDTTAPLIKKFFSSHDGGKSWIYGTDSDFIPYVFTIRDINNIPDDVTSINIYSSAAVERGADVPQEGEFTLVESFDITKETGYLRTDPTSEVTIWEQVGITDIWRAKFKDKRLIGPSFQRRTGYNETLEHMDIRWCVGAVVQGRLAVASVWTPTEEFDDNLVLLSEFDRFATFNWIDRRFRTRHPPTAITEYYGRMIVFEEGHTYVVDWENMLTVDEWVGIGATAPQSVLVNDRGMFFASHRNLFWAAGGGVKVIGNDILHNTYFEDAGYVKHDTGTPTVVLYDTRYDWAIYLWQRGNDIRGWCFDPEKREWITSLHIKSSTLNSGFVDYKGHAWIMTDDGIHRLFSDNDNLLPYRIVIDRIGFGGTRYKSYEIQLKLKEGFTVDPEEVTGIPEKTIDQINDEFKIQWAYDGGDWRDLAIIFDDNGTTKPKWLSLLLDGTAGDDILSVETPTEDEENDGKLWIHDMAFHIFQEATLGTDGRVLRNTGDYQDFTILDIFSYIRIRI